MKKLLLLVMLVFTLGVSASTVEPKASETLLERVSELLDNPSIVIDENSVAEVKLQVIEGKIFVLSVKAKNYEIERFIKGRLNYEKVSGEDIIRGRKYYIPIKFISKQN